jgi:hypothetical protein
MSQLAERVETAMNGAGIKARTFAALVGCHYTTIYDLLNPKNKDAVPLRIVQENIYDALDFLEAGIQSTVFPLSGKLTVAQKTQEMKRLYAVYKVK